MIKITKKEDCCGCASCVNICPKQCIHMEMDSEGFLYPVVEKSACVDCGLCEKACPVIKEQESRQKEQGNSSKVPESHLKEQENVKKLVSAYPKTYAAKNKDKEIVRTSSSGGIFTLLAKMVLEEKGVVFGAVMTEDCRQVVHIAVEDPKELYRLRGSKYVQSHIGDCYRKAKEYLAQGRKVLFTGTPCQIEGLKAYLGRGEENLFTMDIICHGVPSEKVWQQYVKEQEKEAGAAVQEISFRNKDNSWKKYEIVFSFSNGETYRKNFEEDLYMRAFLQDICLRPSCYACKFKNANRVSDVTVADFWGCENILPHMDDDTGTSLLMIHSKKGENLLEAIRKDILIEEVDYQVVPQTNPSMERSARPHRDRSKFFEDLGRISFKELVEKLAKPGFSVKRSLVKLLKITGIWKMLKG